MKKIILLTFLCSAFILFSNLSAQSFQIGPGFGYTTFYSDNLTKSISEGGAGISSGIRYGAKARFLLPVLPLNIVGHFFYSPLSSDGSISNGGQTASVEVTTNMMNVGVGAELTLFPAVVKPYLGVDFLYNKIGESTTKITAAGLTTEQKVDGSSRTGIGVGVGARITILPIIDLEASIKYNMLNLFGKEDGEETLNSLNLNFFVMF